MPFSATWMNLQIIRQSEVRQRQTSYNNSYVESNKNDTSALNSRTERDLKKQNKYGYQMANLRGGDILEVWD